MNLMYFKNLRGDRDGGTTGLLSNTRRTAGIDGGGVNSGGPSYGGVRGLSAGGGANSRSWFNAGVTGGGVGGVSSLARASGPGSGLASSFGTAACGASATGAGVGTGGSTGAGGSGLNTEMHHLRTHPLGLFDLPRHAADGNGGGGFEDADRGASGASRNSALAAGGTSAAASSANNRWSHGGLDRLDPIIGGGSGSAANSRPDYRYTRVDRQRMVDSAVDASGVTGGSRSVRSGLYAGEHQFTGEVCLSVSGLSGSGNARGTVQVSGRTGKQVSFGRHSPDVSGSGNSAATMERERSRESDKRLRGSAGAGGAGPVVASGMSSNKENSENSSRSTFPRSSIVASKRSSPERILATDRGRPSSRDDSADGRRRRPNSTILTAETSLTLPDSRGLGHGRGGSGGAGSSRRGVDGRDVNNRICSNNEPTFDELIDPKDLNLNEIARDCFIIPVHLVNRFLPLGVTLPQTGRASMSVVEVDDPQLVILLHFMTPFMAIQPIFESPLARPASLQGSMASQLLIDLLRDRPGAHGMLLVSIEQDVDYPYINYGVANRQQTNGEEWQQTARLASLERFEPQNLRYFSDHLVDVYEEAATIARPPLQPSCRRPLSNKTGYIVCVYKVFDGDDGEKFERNWLYWTGARILYQCVPRCVGLRRITLHKSVSAGDKLYTLMCECSSFMDHLQEAAYIAPALRARLCGYWSIYRVADVY
ncbi:uncharacterized transmembrane protein DDB_G0289901 [Daphnia magna]|uniref:DUF7153 domain-containing protein n=1 Tax=Daphnia magna TaxID=35525 RepID=A0A162P9D0_9CRUS|nr:uncharacterized transmembrane protein DDB_G0289901 [Daphnia magna]XP_045024519.1 uncharacterized transmembrane protein DDB_G0289901 [Daphnia magna]XP_045024520.1 uncharacterized transmembrane protein DDB_G0289901 [Daphnia magna]XP_045024521.1 uncharacterized transmembrane protein DDB_G0289901 [Daphnia magna]XP_045024522.1 uncharacterized transmembrane protein DDB_G0289901 [Daphnia magna]KZS18652.1 Uncharacterized protein APZ42_015199 [Daphnia magna]